MIPRATSVLLLGGLLAGGCGLTEWAVGSQSEFLLLGCDVLTSPGKAAPLQARLQEGGFLRDKAGREVVFYLDGVPCARALTDKNGFATAEFVPSEARDYAFVVEYRPPGGEAGSTVRADLLVSARAPQAPLAVVDIDKTLAASRKRDFLFGHIEAIPEAPQVMRRIAAEYTIVYLTHRSDQFGHRTKAWLHGNGFPRAPLFLAKSNEFLGGNEPYKSRALATIRREFTGPGVGIGDKDSDMAAYEANRFRPIMVVNVRQFSDADDLRTYARKLDEVPPSVQVAVGWPQVAKILFEGASFGPRDAEKLLRDRAAEMDRAR